MGAAWTFDVTGANGGSVLASDLPWRTAKITWLLDPPGSIEIDLRAEDMSDDWEPGTHRVIANRDAVPYWAGYLTHLGQTGPPNDVRYRVAGLGLEYILDWRIIHHEFTADQTVPEHIETILDDLQVQQSPGGDMNFGPVAVAGGDGPDRLRSYCLGVVAGDAIRELAALGNGFDWFIEADGTFRIYRPTIGGDSGQTLAPENCQGLTVEFDTGDLLTTVTAIGEKSDPFGPRHNLARTALGDVYGRHEVVIDADVGGEDATLIRAELYDAAYEELQRRAGARLQVRAMWVEGKDENPWPWGSVWVGDSVDLDLASWFGGTVPGRCTEVSVSLEPGGDIGGGTPGLEYVEMVFDALVEDITEGAESS